MWFVSLLIIWGVYELVQYAQWREDVRISEESLRNRKWEDET